MRKTNQFGFACYRLLREYSFIFRQRVDMFGTIIGYCMQIITKASDLITNVILESKVKAKYT